MFHLMKPSNKNISFTLTRSWVPRRCKNSGKSLWFKLAIRKRTFIRFKPLSSEYVIDEWYTPNEGLVEQIKG